MVIPFGVTPVWYSKYLEVGEEEATRYCGIKGKIFARCPLRGGLTLTIPVEGGASILKRKDSMPILSEHGKWRREHLGAFQAIYGKTPFFDHLMPEIEEVYTKSTGLSLEEFNRSLLDIAVKWLDINDLRADGNKRLTEVYEEIRKKIEPELSIFDAIFRLGKEGVLGMRN